MTYIYIEGKKKSIQFYYLDHGKNSIINYERIINRCARDVLV